MCGVTADRSYVVASPVDDRHLAYVAMSRHRDEAKLHYSIEDFKELSLVEGLSRSRAKEATTDHEVDIDAFLERREGDGPAAPSGAVVQRAWRTDRATRSS